MLKLLHISSSPRGADSESLALASTFLDSFAAEHPLHSVEHWDLWDGTLPEFGQLAAGAKMRIFAGEAPTEAQEIAWHRARKAFERFAAADIYVFSVPMWNAGVPYILKQLIDVISQPGMVFGFDPQSGYSGLLHNKTAVTLLTSAVFGNGRGPAFGSDFQAPYLADWLSWAGITDQVSVEQRPNLATTDSAEKRLAAHAEARLAGRTLGARYRREAS